MNEKTSRRAFLGTLSAFTLVNPLNASCQVEYVGTSSSIDVVQCRNIIQSLPSRMPSFLAFNKQRNWLFAVNEIDTFQGLATGSVESYSVEPVSGRLELLSRKPLSLSATFPTHLALAPDGRHLVVAVYGGGAYNVLEVSQNGEIGPVKQIIKEIGRGPHPELQRSAHPHSVVFHPSGNFLLGTDTGSDRLNVFSFSDGLLQRLQKFPTPAGSGPAGIEMDAGGSLVTVRHRIKSFESTYRFNANSGMLAAL